MAGAAYLSKDQTTHLAPFEEQVRAQPTFQDIDRKLWHLGAAPVAELEDAPLVADAEMTVENRSSLVIGMSDQVPLWVKVSSKKLVFSADGLKGASWDDRKRWTEIREELKAAQVQAAAEGYQIVCRSRAPQSDERTKFRLTVSYNILSSPEDLQHWRFSRNSSARRLLRRKVGIGSHPRSP